MRRMLPRLFLEHFGYTSFVVEEDGRLIAFLVGFVSGARPDEAYIHFVGVRPDRRGTGIGRDLYERFLADVPMLPVLVGPAESARRVLLYAVATLVASLIPVGWGGFGIPYLLSATIAGGWFVLTCARSWRRPTRAWARRVFTASLVYPFVLFAAAAADRLIAALP